MHEMNEKNTIAATAELLAKIDLLSEDVGLKAHYLVIASVKAGIKLPFEYLCI